MIGLSHEFDIIVFIGVLACRCHHAESQGCGLELGIC